MWLEPARNEGGLMQFEAIWGGDVGCVPYPRKFGIECEDVDFQILDVTY